MHAKESDLFHCPKCRYKCPGKNNLKKHIEVVHDKKINFTCDQCAKGFYEKGQLTNHIKSKFFGAYSKVSIIRPGRSRLLEFEK